MFIESICNDEETLIKNMELKLKYSPDYSNVSTEEVKTGTNCEMVLPFSSCDSSIWFAGNERLQCKNKGI